MIERHKELGKIVLKVLVEHKDARTNDKKLIYYTLKEMNLLKPYTSELFFSDDTPSFESITRARRNAQKLHPELADPMMVDIRLDMEAAFRELYSL